MLIASSTANAQWTLTRLPPVNAESSNAYGIANGQIAGAYRKNAPERACIWVEGTAEPIWLSPFSTANSEATATSGTRQVGWTVLPGVLSSFRASLWSGTRESWVNLHPESATYSFAYGIDGEQQVGYANFAGTNRAALWYGTAASWIDLNPVGSTNSIARAAHSGYQGGYARIGDTTHASLWHGSAASWQSLNPSNATSGSVYAMSETHQAGSVIVGFQSVLRASLWSGTPESRIELHPPSSTRSIATAIWRDMQAGVVRVGTSDHAAFWQSTAESWVDLHQFLPPSFTTSEASGIWGDQSFIHVVGFGRNGDTGRVEALKWSLQTGPVVTFVKADASAGGNGRTWASAYRDLQDALADARVRSGPTQIWLARGTYRPDRGTQNRGASFELVSNVSIIGGFDGTEVAASQADPEANPTVLSGELGVSPLNSFRIVTALDLGANEALLSGLVIRGAVADSEGQFGGGVVSDGSSLRLDRCVIEDHLGRLPLAYAGSPVAGVLARRSSHISMVDCRISGVRGEPSIYSPDPFGHPGGYGWGILVDQSSLELSRCVISQNSGGDGEPGSCTAGIGWDGGDGGDGGGLLATGDSTVVADNCAFVGNSAGVGGNGSYCNVQSGAPGRTGFGGGIAISDSSVSLTNCTLTANSRALAGTLSRCVIRNSILWDDRWGTQPLDPAASIAYSSLMTPFPGMGNLVGDPRFVDPVGADGIAGTLDDDLRLLRHSSCVDAGNNLSLAPDAAFDLDGLARFIDDPASPDLGVPGGAGDAAVVDMGAYERQLNACPADFNLDGGVDGSDVGDFYLGWEAGQIAADLNDDGGIDQEDVAYFFHHWENGC
jgi:hypothetical protein